MARIKLREEQLAERKMLSLAVEEFLNRCRLRNLSPRTIEYYKEDLHYFQSRICKCYADEITKEVLDAFVLHEMDKGNRVTAVNARLRGIRVFINYCAERNYLDGFRYPLLKEDQPFKEPYTDVELIRLLKRPRGKTWSEWRTWAAVNTFLATGIRASTLVNLHVEDVDFQKNIIYLHKLKNRKQQTLPLTPALKSALKTYLRLWDWKDSDYLFPSSAAGKMTVRAMESAVRRYNNSRGVEKTSLHLFRHTFAKNYILAGGGMTQLQMILGHSSLDMTRTYINLYSQEAYCGFERLNPLDTLMEKI